MRIRFTAILLAMVLLFSLASTALAAGSTAQVNNPSPEDRLNLRTRPSANAPSLGKYYNGVHVELLGPAQDGWTPVRFGNLAGYMLADFLEPNDSHVINSALPFYTIDNTAGTGLNLRESPSTSAKSLGFYANGQTGWVYGVGETWCHVQAPDGQVGFMLRERLSPVLAFSGTADDGTTAEGGTPTAVVHNPDPTDRLNLRAAPQATAPTLGKYYNGTYVDVLSDEQDGWTKVRIFGLEGYMMARFLVAPDQLETGASTIPAVQIHNAGGTGLNLRKAPSTNSTSLGLYKNGATVRVFGVSEGWCHVQTEDGKTGFMLRERLSPVLAFDKGSDGSGAGTPPGGPVDYTNYNENGDQIEGTWQGEPGDEITDDFQPGGNG